MPHLIAVLSDWEKQMQSTPMDWAEIKPPLRATEGSAGYDLPSAETATIPPGEQMLLRTGWRLRIPEGYCGQIWGRSGWAMKHRLHRKAGLIDRDYLGEIKVLLTNEGDKPLHIVRGEMIGQLVLAAYAEADVYVQDSFLNDTERGSGGFGSTGGMGNG